MGVLLMDWREEGFRSSGRRSWREGDDGGEWDPRKAPECEKKIPDSYTSPFRFVEPFLSHVILEGRGGLTRSPPQEELPIRGLEGGSYYEFRGKKGGYRKRPNN